MSLPEPPKGPVRTHHNRDLALQKYLLLQEEHDHLRQHLDSVPTLQPSQNAVANSPPVSPTVATYQSSSSSGQTTPYQSPSPSLARVHGQGHRRSSLPAVTSRVASCAAATSCLETVIDETTIAELATEEARLCHVNESIKRVLTELLNCDSVRGDRALRTWVQCRLMDTEKELRTGRRRRSAPEPCMAA
ncbi:hypothetical protein CONLIGDRAFT_649468 [Coniochaeta ligniaria NRRL 30616]|uniref:Uncharacterized protein n=1 Tax=Coniochaeta ligniaria NRRL 30616 TaxID=1408157 RepID=A0A1J7IQR9_9PEZI|nr:hypothetical protein CONLIGDRAFT_649468 [Coniochaeta ligniaria NRRL 30616]